MPEIFQAKMNFISPANMMSSMVTLWVWALVISMIILVAYLIGTWNHDYFTKRNMPCLRTSPFLGNLGPLIFKQLSVPEYIQNIYIRLSGYKYGGVFEFMKPVLLLRDPKIIELVTVKDFEYFIDKFPQFCNNTEPLIGKSLFSLQGLEWKEMRSLLSTVFTSSKTKNMLILVRQCALQLEAFLKKCLNDKDMKSHEIKIEREGNMLMIEMEDLFTRYVNDVIAVSAFGIKCDSMKNPSNEFYKMGKEIYDLSNFNRFRQVKSLGYAIFPTLMKILKITFISKRVINFFSSLIKNRIVLHERKGIIHPNMINFLMQTKKRITKNKNGGTNGNIINSEWDNDDLIAQIIMFLFAGFKTVSTLLCFVSHQLAVYPDIQNRLQEEIDQHLKENGTFTYEDLHNLKYLDMVVAETMRLYPPILFSNRRCVKKYTLPTKSYYTLNPGDVIWIPIYAIHRDPRHFPDPDKFDPERFNDENMEKMKPFTYMPFGMGPRNCIGSRFALMEVKVVLIHLLSKFNFKVISKTPTPIQITKKTLNMTVDGGFWLGLEERCTT